MLTELYGRSENENHRERTLKGRLSYPNEQCLEADPDFDSETPFQIERNWSVLSEFGVYSEKLHTVSFCYIVHTSLCAENEKGINKQTWLSTHGKNSF